MILGGSPLPLDVAEEASLLPWLIAMGGRHGSYKSAR